MASLDERVRKLGYASYQKYIQSAHWRAFRKQYAESGLPTACRCCAKPSAVLHHVDYNRLGRELLSDVVPLCRRCHDAVHQYGQLHNIPLRRIDDIIRFLQDGQLPVYRRRGRGKGFPIGLAIKDRLKRGMPYAQAVREAYQMAGKTPPACLE